MLFIINNLRDINQQTAASFPVNLQDSLPQWKWRAFSVRPYIEKFRRQSPVAISAVPLQRRVEMEKLDSSAFAWSALNAASPVPEKPQAAGGLLGAVSAGVPLPPLTHGLRASLHHKRYKETGQSATTGHRTGSTQIHRLDPLWSSLGGTLGGYLTLKFSSH